MKINFKNIAWSVVAIYVLVMITLHRYPNMHDNQISTGDFANILVGLMAIATLGFSIWDRHRETMKHNSSIALKSYINSIDELNIKLSGSEVDIGTRFLLINDCQKNLLICQNAITEQEHRRFAQAKYETVRTNLKIMYHGLQVENFFSVPKELKDQVNLTGSCYNWSACSYLLVSSWLKYVVPKSYTYQRDGIVTYGMYPCARQEYVCSMLCMLIADPLSIKPTSELINLFEQFRRTCKFELPHDGLEDAFEKYPSLAAHLMLTHTCSAYLPKNNSYPYLSIAVHDKTKKEVWFTFKGENEEYIFGIPTKLANSKYLTKREGNALFTTKALDKN
ncbi:hypothetical protein PXR31_004553 [Vibrio parahaemolyticus]|nr:hypothetical protein [Vibrio parahaemolyticus]HCG7974349.1 hypothetical protein [Vibrio parahaemolyticus]